MHQKFLHKFLGALLAQAHSSLKQNRDKPKTKKNFSLTLLNNCIKIENVVLFLDFLDPTVTQTVPRSDYPLNRLGHKLLLGTAFLNIC